MTDKDESLAVPREVVDSWNAMTLYDQIRLVIYNYIKAKPQADCAALIAVAEGEHLFINLTAGEPLRDDLPLLQQLVAQMGLAVAAEVSKYCNSMQLRAEGEGPPSEAREAKPTKPTLN